MKKSVRGEIFDISAMLQDALVLLEINKALKGIGQAGKADLHGHGDKCSIVVSGEDFEGISRRVKKAVPESRIVKISKNMLGVSVNSRRGGRRAC